MSDERFCAQIAQTAYHSRLKQTCVQHTAWTITISGIYAFENITAW